MKFLLTGKNADKSKQMIVTEVQALNVIELFHRGAVSMEETSYHLIAVGIINKVKRGTVQAMEYKGLTLVIQEVK